MKLWELRVLLEQAGTDEHDDREVVLSDGEFLMEVEEVAFQPPEASGEVVVRGLIRAECRDGWEARLAPSRSRRHG